MRIDVLENSMNYGMQQTLDIVSDKSQRGIFNKGLFGVKKRDIGPKTPVFGTLTSNNQQVSATLLSTRTSNPVYRAKPSIGGFDSHALPPINLIIPIS